MASTRMRSTRRVLLGGTLVATALLGSGCQEEPAEEKEGAGAPFLALSDFTSTALDDLSADDVGFELSGEFDFEADPKDSADDGHINHCEAVTSSPKISASADRMAVMLDADMVECTKKNADEPAVAGEAGSKVTVAAASLKIFVEVVCAGGDMSKYDGKSVADLEDTKLDPCFDAGGTTSTTLVHTEQISDLTYEITDSSGAKFDPVRVNHRAIAVTGASATEGCVRRREGDLIRSEGSCLAYSLSQDLDEPNSDVLMKLSKSGLSFKDDDAYFRSGKIDIELNGWTGAMTYTSPTEAPTYSLTKGGQTADGSYRNLAEMQAEIAAEDASAAGDDSAADVSADDTSIATDSSDNGADATSTAIDDEPSDTMTLTARPHRRLTPRLPAGLRRLFTSP
jgi:hypothetical protein